MRVTATGLSDVGRSRSHNEDSLSVDVDNGLFVIADGMGGHGHGEVASRLAVQAVVDHVEEERRRGRAVTSDGHSPESGADLLEAAIKAAHRRVVEAVAQDQSLVGMGTTLVTLLVGQDRVAVGHVGDSRAYRLHRGELQLVTEDHTWVNEQVKAGYLSEEQARTHPLKSVVTRAVGGDHDIEVDVHVMEFENGDLFLLCSDGLTTMLNDEEIQHHLCARTRLEERCRQLIDDANEHGGVDNVSVVLLELSSGESA